MDEANHESEMRNPVEQIDGLARMCVPEMVKNGFKSVFCILWSATDSFDERCFGCA